MIALILLVILFFQPPSLAQDYTLKLDVQDSRIEIRHDPAERSPYSIAERDITIQIETQDLGDRPWKLSILALEDLHGPEAVTASKVSWQAFTPPFIDGTLVKGVPQLLAQGRGDTILVGRIQFRIESNSYEAGFYDLRMRFILSSP